MNPEFILNFWLDEVGPDRWYSFDESLDGLIEKKFKETLQHILSGGHSLWLTYPSGALAYIIVLLICYSLCKGLGLSCWVCFSCSLEMAFKARYLV